MDAPLAKGGLQHAWAQPGLSTVCALRLTSAMSPHNPSEMASALASPTEGLV